jgi:peptidoglycan/LPS O-acetylase OafA/YrhL
MFKVLRNEMNDSRRVYGLDILRAVAALLIVYLHGNIILEKFSPTLACIPIIDGVDLFFALSGFLIGGIILKEINKDGYVPGKFIKKFLVRRWFRTLPNYYLFLLINIVLIGTGLVHDGTLNKYLSTFFVFMQNFHKPYDFLFWESWSLCVEEWFYFLFPVVLIAVGFLLKKNKKLLFLLCAIAFVIFSTMVRFMRAPLEDFTFERWDNFARKLVICRLDAIGFGLIAAWVHFYYPLLWRRAAVPLFVMGLGIFVVVLQLGLDYNHYFSVTSYFTLLALGSAFLLPLAEQTKKGSGTFAKAITFCSLVSYSMYLCNRGVVAALLTQNFDYRAHPVLFYGIYWLTVILLSALVYNYFEKPITNLRERFK